MLYIPKNELRLRPRSMDEMNLVWKKNPDVEVVIIDKYNKKVFAALNSIFHSMKEDTKKLYTSQIMDMLTGSLPAMIIADHEERKADILNNTYTNNFNDLDVTSIFEKPNEELIEYRKFFEDINPLLEILDDNPHLLKAILNNNIQPDLVNNFNEKYKVTEEEKRRKEDFFEEEKLLDKEWRDENGSDNCDNCGWPDGRNHDCNKFN